MTANVVSLIPVRTRPLVPPRDDLWEALGPMLPALQDYRGKPDIFGRPNKMAVIPTEAERSARPERSRREA